MTNRVVLGALPGGGYGLRVSRPGYDVLDAGLQPKQVAFDSRWTKAGRVFMTGVKRTTYGGNNTVSFGRTFPTLPTVFALLQSPWQANVLRSSDIMSVNNSSVSFIAPAGPPTGNPPAFPPYYDVSYVIMWPTS